MTAAAVLDPGCWTVKAGLAGHQQPLLIPCREALGESGHRGQGKLHGAIGSSMAARLEDMANVWEHALVDRLGVNLDDCKVLLAHPILSPLSSRQKVAELLFEQMGVPALSLQLQPSLALYAQGCVSGLVVDCGHSMSSAVAVVEGAVFSRVTKRVHTAGRHVTQHLLELLRKRGYVSGSGGLDLNYNVAAGLKERLCYVALDNQAEAKLARDTTCVNRSYTLPDGKVIRLGLERSLASEALFDPSLLGMEGPGIAQAAFDAIQDMDMVNRRCLYDHVVLTGGGSMLRGLPTRMDKEMRQLFLDKVLQGDSTGLARLRLKVSAPPNRKHLAWLGGSVLADMMKDHCEFWISRHEYEEDPQRALKRFCC